MTADATLTAEERAHVIREGRRFRQYYINDETLKTIISDGLALRKKLMMGDDSAIVEMNTFRRMVVSNWDREIPLDAVIVGVYADWRRRAVCVMLWSSKFESVPDGAEIPVCEECGIESEWESVCVNPSAELKKMQEKFAELSTLEQARKQDNRKLAKTLQWAIEAMREAQDAIIESKPELGGRLDRSAKRIESFFVQTGLRAEWEEGIERSDEKETMDAGWTEVMSGEQTMISDGAGKQVKEQVKAVLAEHGSQYLWSSTTQHKTGDPIQKPVSDMIAKVAPKHGEKLYEGKVVVLNGKVIAMENFREVEDESDTALAKELSDDAARYVE